MKMRGRTELPEASLILTSVKSEMKALGTLQARTFLAPFGCEEIKVVNGQEEDRSAGTLLIPRFPEEADNNEKGPSSSNQDKSERDDGQGGSRQTDEPMQQDQAGGESTGHRQEECPAWISISSVILRLMQIRWKRLSQRMKVSRHWNLRQPSWK